MCIDTSCDKRDKCTTAVCRAGTGSTAFELCWECCCPCAPEHRGSFGHTQQDREQSELCLLTSGCTWTTLTALLLGKAKTVGLSLQFELVSICFTQEMCSVRFVFLAQGSGQHSRGVGAQRGLCRRGGGSGGDVPAAGAGHELVHWQAPASSFASQMLEWE